jgi:hypothetical protein
VSAVLSNNCHSEPASAGEESDPSADKKQIPRFARNDKGGNDRNDKGEGNDRNDKGVGSDWNDKGVGNDRNDKGVGNDRNDKRGGQ